MIEAMGGRGLQVSDAYESTVATELANTIQHLLNYEEHGWKDQHEGHLYETHPYGGALNFPSTRSVVDMTPHPDLLSNMCMVFSLNGSGLHPQIKDISELNSWTSRSNSRNESHVVHGNTYRKWSKLTETCPIFMYCFEH